ncbi:hypothetical protein [Actinospica sp.]|jgi:hypothetical protein|uniref:hypothetical protein n=1 Tax=Actinospica sp. TaxID=1872142 RepID=UPI002BF5CD0A|nr:hypothetical protein [Actinospica sp.]HWG27979.1 hypothetical protein [Actinospica sp.]
MRQGPSISSRGARRLLRGAPSADPHEQRVAGVLSALAPDDASGAEVPEVVLRAFARNAPVGGARRSGARMLRVSRTAALKAAVVVLALSSGTVAAAAADVLPGPAQRTAHSLLGGWGVPAPRTAAPHFAPTSPATTPSASAGASAGAGAGTAQPSASNTATASPTMTASCSGPNTHAARAHCAPPAVTSSATTSPGPGHPTQTAGHGHTPKPHSGSTH